MRRILLVVLWVLRLGTFALAQSAPPSSAVLGGSTSGKSPTSTTGVEGSYFLDYSTGNLYGPKTSGLWPSSPAATFGSGSATIVGSPTAGDVLVAGPAANQIQDASALVGNITLPFGINITNSVTVTTAGAGFIAPTNTLAHTAYSVAGNAGTGIYFPNANQIALGSNGVEALVANGSGAASAPVSFTYGTTSPATASIGDLVGIKIAASGVAPGASLAKLEWVAGTIGGSCKLIAYAGTSTTPTVVVDNVGSGC